MPDDERFLGSVRRACLDHLSTGDYFATRRRIIDMVVKAAARLP